MVEIREITAKLGALDSRAAVAACHAQRITEMLCAVAVFVTAAIALLVAIVASGGDLLRAAVAMVGAITLLIATMPPVTRRRVIACAARSIRWCMSLDLPPMASLRRSCTALARAMVARAVLAAIRFELALELSRRLAVRLLTLLGAITVSAHPRLATSLVAGIAASSAA